MSQSGESQASGSGRVFCYESDIESEVAHFLNIKHREVLNSWSHKRSLNDYVEYKTGLPINVREVHAGSHNTSMISRTELHFRSGTSWPAAVLIMANCTIGMGLLNFPAAILHAGGIIPAMVVMTVTLQLFERKASAKERYPPDEHDLSNPTGKVTIMKGRIVVLLIVGSLSIISHLVHYYGDVSYQSVVGSYLGRIPRLLARIFICLNNFGALVIFLVVIGDQIDKVTIGIWKSPGVVPIVLHKKIFMPIIATVLIFPLCLMRRFDIFKYTSFLGVSAALYISFGLILTRYLSPHPQSSGNFTKIGKSESNIMKMVPLICFAFECHIEMPPMVTCLRYHKMSYVAKMILGYVLISSLVYVVGGVCGYLSFGNATPDDILMAYESHDPLVIVAFVLLTLKIVTTYPVVFYCLRIVLQDSLKHRLMPYMSEFPIIVLISVVVFIPSVLIATFVPSISSAISIVGGVSALFIFIFPGLCLYKLYSDEFSLKGYGLVAVGITFTAIGTFLAVVTSGQTLSDYMSV